MVKVGNPKRSSNGRSPKKRPKEASASTAKPSTASPTLPPIPSVKGGDDHGIARKPPRQTFPSHLDFPDLPQRIRLLCELIAETPAENIEAALAKTHIPISPEDVEVVLKLSYGSPNAAVKFFRCVLHRVRVNPFSWNLVVDVLGKNYLFDEMWDAAKSMKAGGFLSVSTFASVFSSYVQAGRLNEAFMTFDVLDRYGIPKDVVAVNSLLSAICRGRETSEALEFFDKMKGKVPPDADTFAILLEGCEREGNAARAMTTFAEMISRMGWNSENKSAYDAFLTTLVRASEIEETVKYLKALQSRNCSPSMKFFRNSVSLLAERNDPKAASKLWDIMISSNLLPNVTMYNTMIGLFCRAADDMVDDAYKLLDEMAFNGAFPDSITYNTIFECLIKRGKTEEAAKFFVEAKKNECHLSDSVSASAIKFFFESDDPETAIEVWTYMAESDINPREESANTLLTCLGDLGRLYEVRKFFDVVTDSGIYIHSSTMVKLKRTFVDAGKGQSYERIASRWKARSDGIRRL
ncbi:pentatricopeptide repeat-containing protein At1g77360, mitochondrial-like [Nymphaea colorata]|uniref:Pentacotripeptide-repeat region of PRORP domain-containing protein n=1 Tax=Nymphaea colorata TaxID=210225 RepID=A0A5K1CQA5_9MAGN|nr:pentatricopeptide repeat-containing protein At1g77360, mitochondrial-like [Nymphaea colorata]